MVLYSREVSEYREERVKDEVKTVARLNEKLWNVKRAAFSKEETVNKSKMYEIEILGKSKENLENLNWYFQICAPQIRNSRNSFNYGARSLYMKNWKYCNDSGV